jgi:hypothetical protein
MEGEPEAGELPHRTLWQGKGKVIHMRCTRWLGVVLLVLACAVPAVAAETAAVDGEVTAEQLVYQGAKVEMQVDVNGQAAVQLVGDALDALVATVQEQAKAMADIAGKSGGPEAQKMAALAPVALQALQIVEPVKEAIKSLSRMTVVVMKPKEGTVRQQVTDHYSKLMASRGWTPLLSVRGNQGESVLAMVAGGGRGLFFMVNEKSDLLTGLVTTTRPIGELIGQVIRASGGAIPAIMSARMAMWPGKPPRPPAPPKPPAE